MSKLLYDLPPGIEAGAKRFASAGLRDGKYGVGTFSVKGETSYVWIFETEEDFKRNKSTFITPIDGYWQKQMPFEQEV